MADDRYDLVVIGGGINGAGIAADASARGLRVLLAEAGDLGGATSSASSKLVHGGLRYLEQYAFRLVRESLAEREILLAKAPHIVWPMPFVLPTVDGMRPAFMLRAGLFLYDHLSPRRSLGSSSRVDLSEDAAGRCLRADIGFGFRYWDCWVDDARLVVLNAMAAREAGATVLTRTPVTSLRVEYDEWVVSLREAGGDRNVSARCVVNAAGPWVGSVAGLVIGTHHEPPPRLRLVKGSHIVVRRVTTSNDAFIFQHRDGRVIFALPFEQDFTLIGTTDIPYDGDIGAVSIAEGEARYLLDLANLFFRISLMATDIVWSFSGVRALDDDGSESASTVTRDYRLDLDVQLGPPILHVIGGKITTYRRLAEQALDKLARHLPAMRPSETRSSYLPGGDVGMGGFDAWLQDAYRAYPRFPQEFIQRLARRYGTRLFVLLGNAQSPADLGAKFGAGLTAREVAYLRDHEWAMTADDVLWRRTKTGLHLSAIERHSAGAGISNILCQRS
ncbi:MAG: glycerol-3-phosphate dehydrogenase [Hyphomicrobium sp.]|nr:MAG: glycerol-3-phosphate dehydrogenase [Hyphomicrobium sp.]